MNGFLLDTNVPSELVRPRPEPNVLAWIAAQDLDTLFSSVVSFGEMRKGIEIMVTGKKRSDLEAWLDKDIKTMFSGRILPMTQRIAERWGVLEGQRQLSGQPIGVPDAQIAATALEHGLTVVTRNAKDFTLPGVTVLNPWKTQ